MIRIVVTAWAAIFAASTAQAAVEIQEVETPGGITAWLVEEHSLPFAAIEIRFRGGTSLDADGKRGAVHLMTGLLEEGSGEMDARAFAERREELGAEIGFDSYDDALSVSFRFLTENRAESVDLLKQALTDPAFDEPSVERVREQVLSNLRSNLTDPSTIARETFASLAWGDHPYGSAGEGTLDSVEALTRADIVEAYERAIARDRVYVGAVGDITPDELSQILDTLLGDLRPEGAAMPGEATFQLDDAITVVDFETPQSVAVFGHEGIERDDPDFFAAYIVNEILGGNGLRSRLTDEVRTRRGLTYGIASYLVPKDFGEMVLGQVSTVNDRMGETIEIVREEWSKMAEEGVTAEELENAKLYLTGAYPLRFDGNARIADIMVGMQMDGLPVDYIATRNDRINAVTLEEANRVAARVYQPDALSFVVVGQPDEIEASN